MLDSGRWILLIEYRESSIQFSPSQFLNHLVRVCQIVEQKIWSVPLQSFTRPTAGRNRNGARAKCFSAGDVVIGIADDIDFGRIEIMTMPCLSAFSGKSAQLVPIVMVVRKGPEFKKIPEAVILKLELCTLLQISGQKCEHDIRLRSQAFE